jgi:hypothetical protein
MRSVWFAVAVLTILAPASSPSFAQAPPKPGPEFDILKGMEGTWDATIKMGPMESKGTMVFKMSLGGLWLSSHFDGEFAGMKFEGRGMDSYDAAKKKYVSVWTDSMSTSPMLSEGIYDPSTKKMSLEGTGPGQDGKPVKTSMVTEYKDKDTMISSMSMPGPDGKQAEMMTITYKRK